MSREEDWFLYFDSRMALKIIRPCARTYHHGSHTSPFSAGSFSLTTSLFATTTSLNSLARILAPLVRMEGAGLLRARNP